MIQESKDLLLISTTGSSMFPFIRGNEQIIVKNIPTMKMQIGDVILFQSEDGIKICHRIVKIKNKDGMLWFNTKGDRSKFYDSPVSQKEILGKVIGVKRKKHVIELSAKEWNSLLIKISDIFVCCFFLLKKFLTKIIFFIQGWRHYQTVLKPILCKNINFDYKILEKDTNYKFYSSKRNQIIACVYLTYSKNDLHPGWWGWSLKVKPLYRRLGLGKQLMRNLMEFIIQKDSFSLHVNVSKENVASLRLLESLGFNKIPGSERICRVPEHTYVYMKKDL